METKEFENNLKSSVEAFRLEISGIRSSRPTSSLVENIEVEYMGGRFPIKQLGSIAIQVPKDIVITPWDGGALAPIAKALESAKLGMSPQINGNAIRLKIPSITEERRGELVKLVKQTSEKTRIKVRVMREEVNKKIESEFKSRTISEDQKFKLKDKVQKAVDLANSEIERRVSEKEKDLMEN